MLALLAALLVQQPDSILHNHTQVLRASDEVRQEMGRLWLARDSIAQAEQADSGVFLCLQGEYGEDSTRSSSVYVFTKNIAYACRSRRSVGVMYLSEPLDTMDHNVVVDQLKNIGHILFLRTDLVVLGEIYNVRYIKGEPYPVALYVQWTPRDTWVPVLH